MKIVLPVNDNQIETEVCLSFGRAPYYMVYNTETKSFNFLENTALRSSGGAGVRAAQIVVDSGPEVLITPRCGENADQVLKAAGMKVYKSIPGTAEFNLRAYLNGELNLLQEVHAGLHGHA